MFIPAFLLQDECSFPQSELTEVGPSASSLPPFSEMDVDERPEDKREADKITASPKFMILSNFLFYFIALAMLYIFA